MRLLSILTLTFRELWARKITIGLAAVCTLVWAMLALALNLDIVEGSLAGVRIFGQDAGPTGPVTDPETGEVVREALSLRTVVVAVESLVAGATYWAALLLGLLATASLLPSMLSPGRVDLLLSKPLGRLSLLGGHVLAVLMTMAAVTLYLMGMVWLVMSMKSGIWHGAFLLAMLVVIAMFAVMYGVVVLLGVATRSTPLALIVAYGLLLASGVLAAREALVPQINPPWRQVFLFFYHVLPKAGEVTATVVQLVRGEDVPSWYPLWSSLLFGAVLYLGAALTFQRRDF